VRVAKFAILSSFFAHIEACVFYAVGLNGDRAGEWNRNGSN
jgi:hypothetical protein